MANIINRQQTFSTNGTVTAAGLHNLIDTALVNSAIIKNQQEITTIGTADLLLIAPDSVDSSLAPRKVTVQNLLDDGLTAGTFTSFNLTGALTYGTATGNRTVSTSATITTGTIPSLTAGTTTSTAATITNGTITTGLIPTLTAGTTTGTAGIFTSGTIASLNSTAGTIAALNSTNATIANLSATTSTFLGTITGSTNVVNIGSGQVYKDASGNVGIGTTSPAHKLDVNGSARINSAFANLTLTDTTGGTTTGGFIRYISNGSSGAYSYQINTAAAGDFTTVINAFVIGSDGQIGIGGANYGTSGQVLTSGGSAAAPSWQSVSAISRATAVTSTSGTAIDFTGIPSWVKRITVMFQGVSTSGASNTQIQLGTSSGFTTTGYLGSNVVAGSSTGGVRSTTGLLVFQNDAATVSHGMAIICLLSGNNWVHQATVGRSSTDFVNMSGGSIALSATLDRLRIIAANSTDTFDAGSINIMYEG